MNNKNEDNTNWITVENKKKKNNDIEKQTLISEVKDDSLNGKIIEPCWFYNNGGCKNKDGTEKTSKECKYLHIYSENVKRPPHLCIKKPCDKFNLEGECKWQDNCKYSHRNLTSEEWGKLYPEIPYTLKNNIQKRQNLENRIYDLECRIKILEFKQEGLSRDIGFSGDKKI